MACFRVLNVSNGHRIKRGKLQRLFAECAVRWVDGKEGFEVRNLTLAERTIALAELARKREPLPCAEVHGLRYEPASGAVAAFRQSRVLAFEASRFAEGVA